MVFNIEVNYNLGDILYYMEGNKINSIVIEGISVISKVGHYYYLKDTPPTPEIHITYKKPNGKFDTAVPAYIDSHFYRSKAELLKSIVDQI